MSLVDRIARSLAADPPHDLLLGDLIEGQEGDPHLAAVLVAITDRSEPGLLLTVRREDMRKHPGQVAFPGGRIDRAERERNAAQSELEQLNQQLEARIADRTRELQAKNEQMQEELGEV